PRVRTNAGGHPSLDVFNQSVRAFWLHMFGVDDGFKLALVTTEIGVVVVRHDIQSYLAQREFGVVEVEDIWMIFINQILTTKKPLISEIGIHRRWILVPYKIVLVVPLVHCLQACNVVRYDLVATRVEFLRIQALPPLAPAITFTPL